MTSRQYDLVVFGATGYTGRACAIYVAKSLPTDLKWAIAGRSADKLAAIVQKAQSANPDRPPPAIEVCALEKDQLDALAKKTTVLITTVGPYMKYGTPVLEACANNGTHYLDCTGEVPWYKEMMDKYHDTALRTGAIIIPQCGMDSVPSDLSALLLSSHLRRAHSLPTREIVATFAELNSTPSGGTLNTLLSIFEYYTPAQVQRAAHPFGLSDVKPAQGTLPPTHPGFFIGRVCGVRHDPTLGWLTDGLMAKPDVAITHRSWGLLSDRPETSYGPRFRYTEWMTARSGAGATLWHYAVNGAFALLLLPPVRWLLRRLVTAPGDGPTDEQAARENFIVRSVAYPDTEDPELRKKKAVGEFAWYGGVYVFTAVCMAEAAMCLLRGGKDSEARRRGGGVLTTACLGEEFADRLRGAGAKIEVADG